MRRSEIGELWERFLVDYPSAKPYASELAMLSWVEDLGEITVAVVREAYSEWRRRGETFPPTSGQLYMLSRDAANPAPDFDQAWRAIEKALSDFGWSGGGPAVEALERVPGAMQLVAFFGGWYALCTGGDPARPASISVLRGQARVAWQDISKRLRAGVGRDVLPPRHEAQLPGGPASTVGIGSVLVGRTALHRWGECERSPEPED